MEKGVIDDKSRLLLEQLFSMKKGQNTNPIQFIDLFEVIEPDALNPGTEEQESAMAAGTSQRKN